MVTQPKKHFFYRMYDKAMFSIMHDAIAGLQSSHQARAALPRDALYKSRSCEAGGKMRTADLRTCGPAKG